MTVNDKPFEGKLASFKMISNCICRGPYPDSEEIVEQRFSLSNAGRVTITTFKYANGYPYKMISRRVHTLKSEKLDELRDLIEIMFSDTNEFFMLLI